MTNRIDEAELQAKYAAAVRDFERGKGQRRGEVAAFGMLIEGYADALGTFSYMRLAVKLAKNFCLICAVVIPNILMLTVVL